MGVLSFSLSPDLVLLLIQLGRRTLLSMVVWKNYTLPGSVALKSTKYMARITENSFISDSVSPAVRAEQFF